jgi:hypothetical protein
MVQTGCPATSVTNNQCTLRNIPEQRKAQLIQRFFFVLRNLNFLWYVHKREEEQNFDSWINNYGNKVNSKGGNYQQQQLPHAKSVD